MNKQITKILRILKRKFRLSLYTYAFLAIILFSLSSMIIFFNLFAVRMNPAKLAENTYQEQQLKTEQIIFIVITCLTAFASFIGGVQALFNFEQKSKILKRKIIQIKLETENFKKQKGKYEKNQSTEILINSVSDIIENFEGS